MRISSLALWALTSPVVFVAGNVVNVHAPAQVPSGASKPVPHDFASFSFPFHFFPDFAGNKSCPNVFTHDILKLLHAKTGAHPQIRVGGTSGDRAIYNATQAESILLSTEEDNGIPLEVYLGPGFFEGFENFPGTLWTFQVNLANNKSDALENAITEARIALDHIKGDLVAFEIGNEPDLYPGDVRPVNYTIADYNMEWNRYADAISNEVLRDNSFGLDDWKLFQALTFVFPHNTFTVQEALREGIDSNGHIKTVSRHLYAAGNEAWVRLQNNFLNHTAVVGNLTQFTPEMEAVHAHDPTIQFTLGETNMDFINLNMSQVEGVFGSSIWLVDYLLFGMSLNISRFNLIQGTTFGYSGWVPVEYGGKQPHVRPPLFGQIAVADIIGHDPIVQVQPLDLHQWDLSAYAVYESHALSKYVALNLEEWNATTPYSRPMKNLSLSVPRGVHHATVTRLTGPGASSDTGMTWGGLAWNYTIDGRLGQIGEQKAEIFSVKDGNIMIPLPATEVAVIELQRI